MELITATALLAVMAISSYYLLFRGRRGAPEGISREDLRFITTRQPFVAGPGGHPLPQWGPADALAVTLIIVVGVIAAVILAGSLLGLAAALIAPESDFETWLDTPAGNSFFQLIQWTVTVAVPLLYLRSRGYYFDRATFGFRRTRLGYALGVWLATMFACYFALPAIYVSLVETYQPYELPQQEVVEPFGLTWGGFAIAVIAVAIATPVVEEFFFRGVVHQGMEKRLGFFLGAVASSGIFALAHFPYWELMPIFFSIGFGLALMLRATGSLWPSIVGHFFVNITAVIANYEELFPW